MQDDFCLITIDFGKSGTILKEKGCKQKNGAEYIAPEVEKGDKQSYASDPYLFGKMLEGADILVVHFQTLFPKQLHFSCTKTFQRRSKSVPIKFLFRIKIAALATKTLCLFLKFSNFL